MQKTEKELKKICDDLYDQIMDNITTFSDRKDLSQNEIGDTVLNAMVKTMTCCIIQMADPEMYLSLITQFNLAVMAATTEYKAANVGKKGKSNVKH